MFNSRLLSIPTTITLLLAILLPFGSNAQFSTVWKKTLGGTASDELSAVRPLPEGGFIYCGESQSNDLPEVDGDKTDDTPQTHDAWVLKTDPQGTVLWQVFPGGSKKEVLHAIQPTDDGGFICVGSAESADLDKCIDDPHGKADFWVVKLDPAGRVKWQRLFGGSSDDRALSVVETPEGGFVVAGEVISKNFGRTSLDILVVKLSEFGRTEWQRPLGGAATERGGRAVALDAEGNVLVVGNTESADDFTGLTVQGGADAYAALLSPKGKILWQRAYGGYANDDLTTVLSLGKDGFLLGGGTQSNDGDLANNHGDADAWVLKINAKGLTKWQRVFGGTKTDEANALALARNGQYVFAGSTRSEDGDVPGLHGNLQNPDAWLVQFDENGKITWQKNFGGSRADHFSALAPCEDGGFLVTGFSESLDAEGLKNAGFRDAWMFRMADSKPVSDQQNMVNRVNIRPNPATDQFWFTFENCPGDCIVEAVWFTDGAGKVVFHREYPTSPLWFGDLPNGVYFVQFKVEGRYVPAQRIVVQQ